MVYDLHAVASIDPVQLAGVAKAYLIRTARDVIGKFFGNRVSQRGTIDHEAHFRVESGRTGIEVERPDEHPRAIHGERLGMQAGRRGAGAPQRTPRPLEVVRVGARRSTL